MPFWLHRVPLGHAPSGLPFLSCAHEFGFDPSGGMQWRPSPGMPVPDPDDEPPGELLGS